MKKLTLLALFAAVLGTPLFAQEIVQQAPPACEWYRAHEWDLHLWGTWVFSANSGVDESGRFLTPGAGAAGVGGSMQGCGTACGQQDFSNESVPVRGFNNDRFLARDDTWGGGADVKFFFTKFWALGVEGLVLDAARNIAGGGFGTFTFRYPIGCSRFAPYAWAGFGAMAGGAKTQWVFHDEFRHTSIGGTPVVIERQFNDVQGVQNKHVDPAGQFGTGLEVRITPRIGVMGDFAWVVVDGPANNFGMTRFGFVLSY